MEDTEFQDLRELEEDKEFDFYMAQPATFIENEIRAGRFGNYNQIWEALRKKSTLANIGWDLFAILESNQPYNVKFHCAQVLVDLSGSDEYGIQATHLTNEELYNVRQYLGTLRSIIERKIGPR